MAIFQNLNLHYIYNQVLMVTSGWPLHAAHLSSSNCLPSPAKEATYNILLCLEIVLHPFPSIL